MRMASSFLLCLPSHGLNSLCQAAPAPAVTLNNLDAKPLHPEDSLHPLACPYRMTVFDAVHIPAETTYYPLQSSHDLTDHVQFMAVHVCTLISL